MLTKNCPIEVFADKLRRRSAENQRNAQGDSNSLSPRQLIDIDKTSAESIAKELDLWIEFSSIFNLGAPAPSGFENDIYLSADGIVVYKVNNLMCDISVSSYLNRLLLHNAYFPATRYDLVGFTGFGNGSIYPVVVQDYIPNATYANPDEIRNMMGNLGFRIVNEHTFTDGIIEISDLRPRNVLKDIDNNLYVIDANFKTI